MKKYEVMKLCGTGGTVRDDVNNELVFYNGLKKALDIIQNKYDTFDYLDEKELMSIVLPTIMKEGKGWLNPIFVQQKLKEIFN